jgi:hypothetical protein
MTGALLNTKFLISENFTDYDFTFGEASSPLVGPLLIRR